jgi:steroid delta-isomerase-like uncharacterized protein
MNRNATLALLTRYYAAFNAGDAEGMLSCLAEDVAHDINEGATQTGRPAFRDFLAHMDRCYAEQLEDLVIMASDDGTRGAAEFTVLGTYKATDEGLPEANGQTYILPAGAFMAVKDGLISRVTVYYNLADWTRQVLGEAAA